MSPPPKRFAPPPVQWPSVPGPSVPGPTVQGPVPGRPNAASAAQPQATFGAIRTSAPTQRPAPRDELVASQGDHFLLRTLDRGLHLKPEGTYNFVRVHGATRNDTHTYVSPRSSHAGLAGGKPVIYAGTVRFESGRLDWWSNYSGTYQPVAALNRQAGLPAERFVPWQKLQMGGVGLQRGMLGERRTANAPTRPDPERQRNGPGGNTEGRPAPANAKPGAGPGTPPPAASKPAAGVAAGSRPTVTASARPAAPTRTDGT